MVSAKCLWPNFWHGARCLRLYLCTDTRMHIIIISYLGIATQDLIFKMLKPGQRNANNSQLWYSVQVVLRIESAILVPKHSAGSPSVNVDWKCSHLLVDGNALFATIRNQKKVVNYFWIFCRDHSNGSVGCTGMAPSSLQGSYFFSAENFQGFLKT